MYSFFFSGMNEKLEFFWDRFSKNTQISNSMKIRPLGAELFHVDGKGGKLRSSDFGPLKMAQ